jgi:hypothetical protein
VLVTNPDGSIGEATADIVGDNGQLAITVGGTVGERLAFYKRDYVLVLNPDGSPTDFRANFIRDATGRVSWLRTGGRLAQHVLSLQAATPATGVPGPTALFRRL